MVDGMRSMPQVEELVTPHASSIVMTKSKYKMFFNERRGVILKSSVDGD